MLSPSRRTPRSLSVVAGPFLLWLSGAVVFFRGPLFSGLRNITGDNGDTRLIVYLHEHWISVLRGLVSWRDPPFFFPTTDTLGYSDTFVLDELFYAPLRLFGCDPYIAFQGTLVLLTLVGFVGFYFLSGRILPGHRAICALLALAFTFSNMMYVQAGHSQLYGVYWLPAVVLLVLRARTERKAGQWAAFLAGLLLGVLLLSTYYVAWFFLLIALLWRVTLGLLRRTARTGRPSGICDLVLRHRRRAVAFIAGAMIGGIPFLIVYLPDLGHGGRALGIALDYAAQPRDIINTGARNYFWGPLTRRVYGHSTRIVNGEVGFGLTPILLVTLIGATIYLIRRYAAARPAIGAMPLATAVAAWTAVILPMKFFGVSLWSVIWLVVPGARAIRAVDRMGVITGLLAPLVLAFAIADLLQRVGVGRQDARPGARRRNLIGSATVVLLLITLEQFNGGRNAAIDRPAELAALASVPLPPQTCRAFYLTISTTPPPFAYVSSIDSMLIAQNLASRGARIATINGFSGQFPAGYGSVADPGSADYLTDLRSWMASHGLAAGVCAYDPAARRWTS